MIIFHLTHTLFNDRSTSHKAQEGKGCTTIQNDKDHRAKYHKNVDEQWIVACWAQVDDINLEGLVMFDW